MKFDQPTIVVLPNNTILNAKVPNDLFAKLKEEIDRASEAFNDQLAGHIKEEYNLDYAKDHFEKWLLSLAEEWYKSNPGFAGFDNTDNMILESLWVNKQKKYEFNPIHMHSGLLSFVIWVNIPYDLEEELNYFPLPTGTSEDSKEAVLTSKFCFVPISVTGHINPIPIPIDKTFEGTVVMFPANLHHTVYPFYTSDGYRISVSGNINTK